MCSIRSDYVACYTFITLILASVEIKSCVLLVAYYIIKR